MTKNIPYSLKRINALNSFEDKSTVYKVATKYAISDMTNHKEELSLDTFSGIIANMISSGAEKLDQDQAEGYFELFLSNNMDKIIMSEIEALNKRF